MSAGWHSNRSADHLVRWFSTGVDGARRSSSTERAKRCRLDNIAHSPSMQTTSAPHRLRDNAEQRAAIGGARLQPSAINRHRR